MCTAIRLESNSAQRACNTNVTHQIIHPNNIHQCQYDPDNRITTTNLLSSNVIPSNANTNFLNVSNHNNAPGHVRFTSASTAPSSVASYSSSNPTHPKSILRRKNLDSSSNVMTSSNQTNNNQNNGGWDSQQG